MSTMTAAKMRTTLADLDYHERRALTELAKKPDGWDHPEAYLGYIHLNELVLIGFAERTLSTWQIGGDVKFHHYKLTADGLRAAREAE